jgi:hypothetical protein
LWFVLTQTAVWSFSFAAAVTAATDTARGVVANEAGGGACARGVVDIGSARKIDSIIETAIARTGSAIVGA